uniref:5'-3' DNA helicase ZGRF1-like N-terminal domain-containing protein n=1 Tax=Propithecus coquereli TaxID=379532 RepID=A0A2K6FME6_PROCO
VLYTHQKTKKSKVWQDGILKITHLGNKVKPGDNLEGDRYLITVEEVKVAGSVAVKQDIIKEAPELNSRRFISSGRSLGCQPAGLKRKFTGFQGPRQVPKKTVITENGESSTSLEAKKPSPTFFSPFYSTPPLFPTVGNKNTNTMSTDPENIVTYKNRERNGMPFSSVVSDPSFKINPAMLCEDNYFCSAISSGSNHSDSLLTSEPKKRDNLSSHCLGVSQNIRSKAQILALLKSKSASTCEKLNSEVTGHFPPIQPQETLKIATKPIQQEEWAEMKSTGNLHYQHPSENTMRNKSRWAVYLSSQSSPILSTADGNDMEGKPKAQKDDINLNLKELLVQKRTQFFETCTEKGKKCNVDKPVDNNDSSWNQEVKLELPSFCESDSLQVSSPENDGVLSESDIQENTKIRFNQMDTKGSILTRKPFTTEVSQAIPKSSHPNQDSQQFFSLGSEEETAFLAVTSKQIERKTCDPKPVEFQGHQVKGSATSGVMIRGHSAQLGGSHFPDSTECGNFMTDACFLTPKLPSTCTQTDFLQSTSPEQKISTLSPVSMFSLNSRDEDFMLEFSEKSLKARTLPGDLHFLNLEGSCYHIALISVCRCKVKLYI